MFSNKSRYWAGILYSENLMDNWLTLCPDIVQVPFACCEHNKDLDSKGEFRKSHVHMILAFSNTTTERHAKTVFNLLSAPGQVCCSTVQPCISVRNSYDYLTHDTDTCRKLGKHQYDPSERVCGNGFDIGVFEQLSQLDRIELIQNISDFIVDNGICSLDSVYAYVKSQQNVHYIQIFASYSGLFERLCKSVYFTKCSSVTSENTRQTHTENDNLCCIECGSIDVKKNGKTRTGSVRYRCKDCGKSWS